MQDLLGRLRLDKLIVHEVPDRGSSESVAMSEVESSLNQVLKNYFREKIAGSLASAAFPVTFDPQTESPVPELVVETLAPSSRAYIKASQAMAAHLYASQNHVNPAGLLCVAELSAGNAKCLSILKLEKEAGIRLKRESVGGKTSFSMDYIRELMLTEKTKVFKASLFVQKGKTVASVDGLVSDHQRSMYSTVEVANFFLRRFLGCTLREQSDVTTKRFFEAATDFINEEVDDPETKARYQIALLSEVASNKRNISPRAFARDAMETDDAQLFVEFLKEKDLRVQEFEKDNSLVKPHLKRIQMSFRSGISVISDPAAFEEHVTVEGLDDGRTRLKIEDGLKRVDGRG